MAQWQKRRQQQGGGNKPALSVSLSVKQGNGYVKGPSFGFWTNDQGGPSYRGTLKGEYLDQVIEFLVNASEAGIPVGLALFKNDGNKPGFKKPQGRGFAKPNPFKKQPEPQEPEQEQAPEQDEDIPF